MSIVNRIKELKLELPPQPKPVGAYTPVRISGNMAFLSGQVSRKGDGVMLAGKVGKDLTTEQGKEAARIAALNALSVIQSEIGWERFGKILRVSGFVQAAPDFYDISAVVNGASELFLAVFGESGVHARTSIGMASLPMNAAVEVELTLELKS